MPVLLGLRPLRVGVSESTGLDSGVWPRKYPDPPRPLLLGRGNPCFLMLRVLCNVMVKHRDAPDPTMERFFNAVAVMTVDDIHSVQIVTSPTSPKPRLDTRGRPPPPNLMSLWSWPPRVWGQQGVLLRKPP